MISEGLRQQVNTFGIRTTVISPGAVDTQLTGSITEADIGVAGEIELPEAARSSNYLLTVQMRLRFERRNDQAS